MSSIELADKRQDFEERLIYQLCLKSDTDIKINEIPDLPNFDRLDDDIQLIILSLSGTKTKSPNKKFIKSLLKAFNKFPILPDSRDDISSYVYNLINVKNSYDTNTYPEYSLLSYSDRKELYNIIPDYKIKDTLTQDELQFVQKSLNKKYIKVLGYLNDGTIRRYIKEKISDNTEYTDNMKIINALSKMPELFEFIKQEVLNETITREDWKSFNGVLSNISTENISVVSSSFSTTYYYDVDVNFKGKKFTFKKVQISSAYTSGGWN